MKFFDENFSMERDVRQSSRRTHFFLMFAAVMAAFGMWYYVTVHDRIEAQVEVGVNYFGIPPNLVVTEGLVNKLIVRLRGPEALLRSIPKEKFTEAIDLSNIKKGDTVIPMGGEKLEGRFRAFDVVDIQPTRIVVRADNLVERSVPVKTEIDSPLKKEALTVENVTVAPGNVIIRGPESVISRLSAITVPLRPDTRTSGVRQHQTMTLDTPSFVSANPATVRVSYTITSGRTSITRTCPVEIAEDTNHLYTVQPKEVTMMIEVPDALAKNEKYLNQLEVNVVPPPMDAGESRIVKLKTKIPEGMSILHQTQMEVTLTRKTAEN